MDTKDDKGNSGDGNSGYRNSGYGNSGYRNSGDWNSGDGNSGYRNSGDGNSGYRNSGDGNSGYRNSGNWNSGGGNSGYRNSGNWNSGDRNSGYGNSGYRNSGIFCTITPPVTSFNKPTTLAWNEIDHPSFSELRPTQWVAEAEMTDAERAEVKDFHVRGGYLKTYTWKEAWGNYWRNATAEERAKVQRLPNFDASIFEEITGIAVGKGEETCNGKVVEIDGKRYKLQEVK